ncbi:MAG: LamG-like jellyroll fold domain-containing protein [Bacteroidota bacterium]
MKHLYLVALTLAVGLTFSSQSLAQGAGNALYFDGVNDYVTAGTPDVIASAGNNGLTISAWIKADDFVSDMGRIITKTIGIAEQDHYWMLSTFNQNGIKLRFRLKTSTGGTKTLIASSGDLIPGTWTHVAAVYDGSNMILYKDGVEVGRTAKTGTIATNTGIAAMIGNNGPSATSRPFKGLIEEVRLLNVGLTAQQVREQMHKTRTGTESDLVAYWRQNEGTGSTAEDNSGNLHTGVLRNGTGWQSSTAPLGAGASWSAIVGSTGQVDFSGTDLDVNFTVKSGSDQIVATRIDNKAEGTQPVGVNSVFTKYWVVNRFGNGTFTSTMTFTLGNNVISLDDQLNPANLKLFRRDFNSDGAWTEIAVASNATSNEVAFDGITAPGQYAVGTVGDSPLPIQLAYFGGSVVNTDDVLLSWQTVTELNNYGFYVERRLAGQDLFVELPNSFVAGNGTTIQPHEYSWTDENLAPGRYYYRLRQVDLDGTTHHTDATEVNVDVLAGVINDETPNVFALAQNYPNPFNPSTKIQFSVDKSGLAEMKVFNLVGQEVATLYSGHAETGKQYQVSFDAENLPNGVYFYKLTSNNQSSLKKMTLLK